jgi:hypothetical protein
MPGQIGIGPRHQRLGPDRIRAEDHGRKFLQGRATPRA